MKWRVWSVKGGMCEMSSVEWRVRVRSVECEVWSAECQVWSVKCGMCGVCGV